MARSNGRSPWRTPNVFVAPWRTTSRYNFHPEFKRVEEYICTENLKNYDYLVDPTKAIK